MPKHFPTNSTPLPPSPPRVRFLLGGRHGDFKFLPPAGYSPCYEALLPKEKMYVEPVKEYKRDHEGIRDLLGTTHFLSQASFIPTPVDTTQVRPGPGVWGRGPGRCQGSVVQPSPCILRSQHFPDWMSSNVSFSFIFILFEA